MIYDKILGCIMGAAVGDAMGSATEGYTLEQIRKCFNGQVTEFQKPAADTFANGNEAGQVTDDFSSFYFVAKAIADKNGQIDRVIICDALRKWSTHNDFFDRYATVATKVAFQRVFGEPLTFTYGIPTYPFQATNSAAIYSAPIGLFHVGNIDKAIYDAAVAASVAYDNSLSISGACAVAAAISKAAESCSDLYSVISAGLYGAREGERLGKEMAHEAAGASVVKRMELAIDLALSGNDCESNMKQLADKVGCGPHVSETVPAAFGLLLINAGNVMDTVFGGVNIGYDTDAIASIGGAIAGALKGYGSIPSRYTNIIERINSLHIIELASKIGEIIEPEKVGG